MRQEGGGGLDPDLVGPAAREHRARGARRLDEIAEGLQPFRREGRREVAHIEAEHLVHRGDAALEVGPDDKERPAPGARRRSGKRRPRSAPRSARITRPGSARGAGAARSRPASSRGPPRPRPSARAASAAPALPVSRAKTCPPSLRLSGHIRKQEHRRALLPARQVALRQRDLGLQHQRVLVRAPLGRGADVMDDRGLGRDPRPGAAGAGAVAQVGLLAVHHEGEVEAAELVPEGALDQEEAAADIADLALGRAVPGPVVLGVEDRRCR